MGAEEMVQWLSALAALLDDLGLILNTQEAVFSHL